MVLIAKINEIAEADVEEVLAWAREQADSHESFSSRRRTLGCGRVLRHS